MAIRSDSAPLIKLLPVFFTIILLVAPILTISALNCMEAASSLSPCVSYLTGQTSGLRPPKDCCLAVVGLNNTLRTRSERQAACECIKMYAINLSILKQPLVSSLPRKCHVKLSFAIGPKMDCNK